MTDRARFDVSVVIPLYNKAPFIARTLNSVLAQTLPPREIIIVNDSSTDGSAAIVADVIAHHPDRGLRLVNQPNAGPGSARNRGIAEVESEWVALLDGDDLWTPNHLETLADVSGSFPAANVLATSHRCVRGDEVAEALIEDHGRTDAYLLDYFDPRLDDSPVWSSSVALRKKSVARSGGFGTFWPGEDTEYWARLALDHQFAATDYCTGYYVQGTGGLMDQHETAGGGGSLMQPIFETIDHALADPALADRHVAIRRYRAHRLRRNIRQALYRGSPTDARVFQAILIRHGERPRLFDAMLSFLPAPILRTGLLVRRKVRRTMARLGGA